MLVKNMNTVQIVVTAEENSPHLNGHFSGKLRVETRGLGDQQDLNQKMSIVAGTLMGAYINSAKDFLKQHPAECKNCPAYLINKRSVEAIEATLLKVELDLDLERQN